MSRNNPRLYKASINRTFVSLARPEIVGGGSNFERFDVPRQNLKSEESGRNRYVSGSRAACYSTRRVKIKFVGTHLGYFKEIAIGHHSNLPLKQCTYIKAPFRVWWWGGGRVGWSDGDFQIQSSLRAPTAQIAGLEIGMERGHYHRGGGR